MTPGPVKLRVNPAGALGGALGGLIGFLLGEGVAGQTLLWSAAIGLGLGAALTATENWLGLRGRLTRDLGRASLNAAIVGAISGALGQYLYASAGAGSIPRALGWACLGAGVGLVLGFADKSLAKSLRGAAGGAVGGFLGGLVFNTVFALFSSGDDTGTLSRAVGLVLMGAAIGLTIGLVQQLLKSAWLMGLSTGPYEGKEYILAKRAVTVGRSEANDVSLYREEALPPQAGAITAGPNGWAWAGEPVLVNGVSVARSPLASGDTIRFGGTEFLFQVRGAEAGEAPALPAAPPAPSLAAQPRVVGWVLEGSGERLELPVGPVTLGRSGENGLTVDDPTVSSRHASLEGQPEGLLVTDLGSTNGTFLNGVALAADGPVLARPGDAVRFGQREYRLRERS